MNSVLAFITKLKKRTGKKSPLVGLFGLGKCNSSIARILRANGCGIIIRSDTPLMGDEKAGISDVPLFDGIRSSLDIFEDALVFSPSVRRDRPAFRDAARRGVVFTSDAEMFFSGDARDVLAVTGSDGKSTVTDMTAAILNSCGKYALSYPCGNFGLPYSLLPDSRGYAVAELSSFNLTYLTPRSARAVITNITPNHLNWHSSMSEYVNAKLGILSGAEGAVLPADGGVCESWAKANRPYAVFSDKDSLPHLMRRVPAEHYLTLWADFIELDGHVCLNTRKMIRREPHNILNSMAAAALTHGFADEDSVREALYGYRGLAHRCQTVGVWRGVEYINSSIDTSPKRTSATLLGLGKRVHLILGGRDKGLPLADATEAIGLYAERIYIYGECREIYDRALSEAKETANIPRELHGTLYSAASSAAGYARCGDTVLLSPGATAYGEFRSFAERGSEFCRIAEELNNP